MARRTLLILMTLLGSVLLFASPASAHNTLLASDPADGAVVASAPTQLTLLFSKSVPLDTLSIEMIDASGVRSDLSGSEHGPQGDTQVVTPLPSLPPGAVNLRWRLVGPDGHAITGRISFTIAAPATTAPATTTPPATTPATGSIDPAVSVASTVPPTLAPITAPATTSADDVGFEDPWTTSSTLRWLLRFSSYVAILTIGGVLTTTAFVWSGAWDKWVIRRAVAWSLGVTLFATIAQLLVIASDIKATPPWESIGGVSAAMSTDAGVAFAIRIVLVVILAWVIFGTMTATDESRWTMAVVLLLLLLATWAFAGHSRSMRWPLIGVPLDVAHHAAAAAWIGGLAILGLVAIKESTIDELITSVNRFAQLAKIAVTVIVITGVLQAFRLVGSPGELFAGNHGRYLVLKVLVLGAMLKVADVNRQRVNRRLQSTSTASRRVVGNLRRAMGTELVVGVLVVAVTAAMVVSPPAVAEDTADSSAAIIATSTTVLGDLAATTTTTASVPVPTCVMTGTAIRLGDVGLDVVCLQEALIARGYMQGVASGAFDAATDAAVRSLQSQNGLDVDGIVGQFTATVLGIWPSG